MIEARGLTVMYGRKTAIDNLSFSIKDREHLILMGKNGSGKTTLLKAILGFVNYEGEILVNGKRVSALNRREIAREIAYVPQIFSSSYTFTVKEFVSMGLYSLTRDWWEDDERVLDRLRSVGIYDLRDKMINNLSGGELQKAVVSRALVQDSKYILMDEPTAHLDIKSVRELLAVISMFDDKGIIMVSHDLNPVNKVGGEVMLLREGTLIFKGSKEDKYFNEKMTEAFDSPINRIGNYLYFPLT